MEQPPEHPDSLLEPDPARYASVLGDNVRRLRKLSKINKKTFALMVGIGRPQLDKIERGTADIRLSSIVRLADALEVTPVELLSPPEEVPCPECAAEPRSGDDRAPAKSKRPSATKGQRGWLYQRLD